MVRTASNQALKYYVAIDQLYRFKGFVSMFRIEWFILLLRRVPVLRLHLRLPFHVRCYRHLRFGLQSLLRLRTVVVVQKL